MRNPKASSAGIMWRDGFRIIKLCFMGLSMVSVPLFVKPAFVASYGFFSVAVPKVRETLSAWFTPAFLYLVLNCIILAIVANSGIGIFNVSRAATSSHPGDDHSRPSPHQQQEEKEEKEEKPKAIVCEESESELESESCAVEKRFEPTSMPAASAAADTLEDTWNAITESRRPPPTRQLRKSDTWETRRPHPPAPETGSLASYARFGKSETWNSGRNLDRQSVGAEMLRKEPSLGQDELNKRVEAFIAKVNHDMKLQREQSLVHYMEMVNRGSG